jgi:hypothetical protein
VAKAQRQPSRHDDKRGGRRVNKAVVAPAKKSPARGKANRTPSRFRKVSRAVMMLVLMVAIGFFGMLVIDLGGDAIARMRVGGVTVAELWDKLSDRLLDRDVPVVNAKPAPRPSNVPRPRAAPVASTPPTPANHPISNSSTRAPLPAPSVREYGEHVEAKPDPQTELARRRLDALMGRL